MLTVYLSVMAGGVALMTLGFWLPAVLLGAAALVLAWRWEIHHAAGRVRHPLSR